jgi:arabinogalactan endo-1,4-beta-galactosidase
MVAETDWPATSCSTTLSASYPKTPAGQVQWQQAITSVLSALPGGHGKGVSRASSETEDGIDL